VSGLGAFLAAAADLKADHHWEASAGDLALEVAGGLVGGPAGAKIDAVFVAAPIGEQAALAPVLVDRLGLAGKVAVYQLESGDGSGAAALHAAAVHVAAKQARCALVLGVAKVSDLAERERGGLLDALVDRDAEAPLGLSYQALAGLLADLYVTRNGLKPSTFAHVIAKNAANAVLGGETFLPHAPSALELVRDIQVAPPLVRSDFAPLLDGASAVLVTDAGLARELTPAPVEIVALGSASDLSVIADRPDPLAFAAAAGAGRAALARANVALDALAYLDVSSACTVLEVLALEALGVTPRGQTGALCKDGFGRVAHAKVVNPGGGAQGRGLALGTCGIAQAREAFLQLGGGAGKRQAAAALAPGARSLALGVTGRGVAAHATNFARTVQA
jgi:acetyl-CoA C-acetyltransferase